jgi:acetone carboxylase gamma subunit
MKILCKICNREFEAKENELEFDETDPSGRSWIEIKDEICPNCKEDLEN